MHSFIFITWCVNALKWGRSKCLLFDIQYPCLMLSIAAQRQCTLVSLSSQRRKHLPSHPLALVPPLLWFLWRRFPPDQACGRHPSSGRRWNNIVARQSYTNLIYISKHGPWTVAYSVCSINISQQFLIPRKRNTDMWSLSLYQQKVWLSLNLKTTKIRKLQ